MASPQQRKKVIAMAVALLAIGLMSTASQAASGRPSHRRSADRGQHDRPRHDAHADKDNRITIGVTIGGDYSRGHHRWQRMPHRPGRFERRWVEPVYGTTYDACGREVEVIVHKGYYTRQWVQRRPYHRPSYRRHTYRSRGGHGHHNSSGLVISGTFRF